MGAVFVTGATGTVGRAVVDQLVSREAPVVAAVRETETVERPGSVETRAFDFAASAGELAAALEGCDRLFLMRPPAIEDVRRYLSDHEPRART